MKFQLYSGAAALSWLDTTDHQRAWRDLQEACPWATPYQSPDFARVWFRHYAAVWGPLLVIATNAEGVLIGLLPLTRRDREIVGVGARQAEYQGWLCSAEDIREFLDGALNVLFQAWPDAHLCLRYIDVTDALEHLLAWAECRDNVILDTHDRPLMELDANAINAVLRKRANRSKLNRLKRAGELVLKKNDLATNITASLNEISAFYDFRQGATNDSCPFVDDDHKRAFHLDWLAQAPGQLCVFRILLNGRTVAALLGVQGPRRLSNAIIVYSPHYARHSPGKLLLYQVAQSLLGSEVDNLDLTPGSDSWKGRFATHHDQVYELNAWRDAALVRRRQRRDCVKAAIHRVLVFIKLPPLTLRNWLARLRRIRPRSVWNLVLKILPRHTEYRIYRMRLNHLAALPAAAMVDTGPPPRIDALDDLVHYSPVAAWQSRQKFLSAALERIERGERVYSARTDGVLLHYGWRVREQSEAFFTEVGTKYRYPEPGTVLYDFFTHPNARGQGWYQRTLACMLRDLESATDGGPRVVYISVLADNEASRHVIEKLGFDYLESLIRVSAFGWSRRYQVSAGDKP